MLLPIIHILQMCTFQNNIECYAQPEQKQPPLTSHYFLKTGGEEEIQECACVCQTDFILTSRS